jgi:sporulation protein YlmC with PRC-barrel domain
LRGRPLMQLKQDASVKSANGEDLGRLDRVVIDPKTGDVTNIVVRKGFFFSEDRVIPVEWIESTNDEEIRLREDVEDFENLPVFEQAHYLNSEDIDARYGERTPRAYPSDAPPVYWYPPVASPMGFPAHYTMPMAFETERNIPEGTIALKDNSKVFGNDGEDVGSLERVFSDEEGRVTHIVIIQGMLSKSRKLVPTHWIKSVAEDEIHLGVNSDYLDKLPEFEE